LQDFFYDFVTKSETTRTIPMKIKNSVRLISLSLLLAFATSETSRAESGANAQISAVAAGPDFNYTITLDNPISSSGPIGTFWYGWIPGQDYLPTSPISVTPPTGWTDAITHGGPSDGYAIQFIASNSSFDVGVGSTLNFSFLSADSPAALNGNSPFYPATPVGTSFVYSSTPFSDAGDEFVVQPAPEPSTWAMLAAGTVALLGFRRRRILAAK
jgi:hypothetical protein